MWGRYVNVSQVPLFFSLYTCKTNTGRNENLISTILFWRWSLVSYSNGLFCFSGISPTFHQFFLQAKTHSCEFKSCLNYNWTFTVSVASWQNIPIEGIRCYWVHFSYVPIAGGNWQTHTVYFCLAFESHVYFCVTYYRLCIYIFVTVLSCWCLLIFFIKTTRKFYWFCACIKRKQHLWFINFLLTCAVVIDDKLN